MELGSAVLHALRAIAGLLVSGAVGVGAAGCGDQCSTDGDCGASRACSNGACVFAAPAPKPCGAVIAACGCWGLTPGVVVGASGCQSGHADVQACWGSCGWAPATQNVCTCQAGGGSGNTPTPIACSGDYDELTTHELAASVVDRDACELATPQEIDWCTNQDGTIWSLPTTLLHADQVARIAGQAGISASVPISVAVDVQALTGFGGGVTGTTRIVIDAKLLDVMFEVANLLGMLEQGETAVDFVPAIDAVVAHHGALVGQSSAPAYYLAGSPAARDAATRHFDGMSGFVLYHEFGHYWSWACVDTLRSQYGPAGGFFAWPSFLEDQSDGLAGVLAGKAGHALADAQMAIDLMAFLLLWRQHYVHSFTEIESAYLQYVQSSAKYSSLAKRKEWIARGFDDWSRFGAD